MSIILPLRACQVVQLLDSADLGVGRVGASNVQSALEVRTRTLGKVLQIAMRHAQFYNL